MTPGHLEAANAWLRDRVVRTWQRTVFATGALPPDLIPEGFQFTGTFYLSPPKAFGYRFADGRRTAWLFTGSAAAGYELEALWLPEDHHLVCLQGEPSGLTLQQMDLAGTITAPPVTHAPVRLIVGQVNFAHLLWNELPALIDAEQWPTGALTETIVTHEPLGPLHRILRWPHGALTPATDAELNGFHPACLLPLGAALVTPETKARVRAACGAPPWRRTDRPVLWISLRLMYRHPINQMEAFTALFEALERQGAAVDILLDGFSLPADVHTPGRYQRNYYQDHNDRVRALAARLTAARYRHLRFHDATGSDLPATIALAGQADYYIANAGTQQHKIGWLYDIPGLIHANARWSRNEPNGIWVSAQAGSNVLPIYLPASLIAEAATDNERQDHEDFRDYRFTDPNAVAAVILADLRRLALLS